MYLRNKNLGIEILSYDTILTIQNLSISSVLSHYSYYEMENLGVLGGTYL